MKRWILLLFIALGIVACESKQSPNSSGVTSTSVASATRPLTPVSDTKTTPVESHEGKEFYGWECKNLEPLITGREVSLELVGPIKFPHQEHMAVTVWLHNPQGLAWQGELHRARYLGGPNKGKLTEDFWESQFTNGVNESRLNLGKDAICARCSTDYDGWRFSLTVDVPKQDDPTQLNHYLFDGTCEERWLASHGKTSPVVQPKDWARQ